MNYLDTQESLHLLTSVRETMRLLGLARLILDEAQAHFRSAQKAHRSAVRALHQSFMPRPPQTQQTLPFRTPFPVPTSLGDYGGA